MAEDLIKVAGPMVVNAVNRSVLVVKNGSTAVEAFGWEAKALQRNLKRKAPAMVADVARGMVKRKATSAYKRALTPLARARDIFS